MPEPGGAKFGSVDPAGSEREQRLVRLLEVGRSLVSELELDVILQRVLAAARELTGAQYAALGVLDESRQELERFITSGIDDESHRAIGDLPRGRGVLGVLISDPRPLRLGDVGRHAHSFGFPAGHPSMSSFLGVPILVRGEVYGNLYLTEKQGGVFEAEDEETAVVLAKWAAVAIDNARAYATAESRRAELERAVSSLEATTAIAQTLAGETDLDHVLELIVKRGRALTDARSMVVMVPRGPGLIVAAVAGDVDHTRLGELVPIDGSICGEVFRSGRPDRVADVGRLRSAFETEAQTGLFVPLRFRGRVLGVLAAFDRLGTGAAYSARDEQDMVGFAASAAAALATAQDVAERTQRRTVAAAEGERARWARELHDDTLQELAALKLLLASIHGSDTALERQDILREASGRIDYAVRSLRGLITDLRPPALDDVGLEPALEALSLRVREASGLQVTVETDLALEGGRETSRLTRELEETTYRLVQECLNNVVKHAHASRVTVTIRESAETLEIEVRDDGQGFDATQPTQGFGLVGMTERVTLVGGIINIDTVLDSGTGVSVSLPVQRADAHHAGLVERGR